MAPKKDRELTVGAAKKRGAVKGAVARKAPRVAANGHKLPEQLPSGLLLTDVVKCTWRLGKSVGVGGFGEIYLASNDVNNPVSPDARYVIKIEPHNNGPLFAEMHFYHRVGKEDQIQAFVKTHKLDYLGMPRFVASGSLEYKGIRYRFMVMDRFGEDLQKIFNKCNRHFLPKTVYTMGIRILDILQYIHSAGYIHADVKGSNLLLGFGKGQENKVYLIDFGLACKYLVDGVHKEYKEDLRKAHDGTIEFTSRDAHIGAHSRRGDLEILGYNMLQWLSGELPWEENLKDPEYVKLQKLGFMSNITGLMNKCFPRGNPPEGIVAYFQYISQLQFEEEPDYDNCRAILRTGLKKAKLKDDMKLVFNIPEEVSTGKLSKKRGRKPIQAHIDLDSDTDVDLSSPNHPKGRRKATTQRNPDVEDPPTFKGNQQRGRKSSSSRSEALSVSRDSSYDSPKDSSLENPTPAMLQVMERKLELQRLQQMEEKFGKRSRVKGSKNKGKARHQSPDPYSIPYKFMAAKHASHAPRIEYQTSRQPLTTRPTQPIMERAPRTSYSPEI